MPPSKTRYVTACQQVLALGAVVAVLTPAASVVSLDVVREAPTARGLAGGGVSGGLPEGPGRGGAEKPAYAGEPATAAPTPAPSPVPAEPVEASVEEVALTAPATPDRAEGEPELASRRTAAPRGRAALRSEPQEVSGYGAVGVTWQHGAEVDDEEITFEVRTREGDSWSSWQPMAYHDEHAPDPDSAEARRARPGTTEMLVGEVDEVQVQVSAEGELPADMKLAVVDPGEATEVRSERPDIETDELDGPDPAAAAVESADSGTAGETAGEAGGGDALRLQAAAYTAKPTIYSRAQWGADERLRDKGSLHYYEVHAGFVHHTVNANDYTRAEVPGILRSIYAYHTRSRGWSDIGYNFLVDKFGRIWEGRYGGVDRPVVGAHTLGYNDYAFAMSAIGNFDTAQPSAAMVQAYGSLFAWKLSLHGVDASSTAQVVGSKVFPAVNGHRDAGSTACPGRYLYAQLGKIRDLARSAQRGWVGRELESDVASTPHPDLVARRISDGKAYVLPTGGLTRFLAARTVSTGWSTYDVVVASPDLTGDGRVDVVVRSPTGATAVRPGDGKGGFGAAVGRSRSLAGRDLVTAVGDLDRNGRNDLVARWPGTGRLDVYLGSGTGTFTRRAGTTGWSGYDLLTATGDLNGDGRADLLARDTGGRIWLHPGNGAGGFGSRSQVPGSWSRYETVTGLGDYTADGRPDLFARTSTGAGYVLPSRGDGTLGRRLGPFRAAAGLTGLTSGGTVAGNPAPDLLGRKGDALVLVRNAGTFDLGRAIPTGADVSTADVLLNVGDWDRDGHSDLMTRHAASGALELRRGNGLGRFGAPVHVADGFSGVGLLAAVGDMTGDGFPDLMGQPRGGSMRIYPGRGLAGLAASYVAYSPIGASRQVGVGRWNADGAPDSLIRDGDELSVYAGNGPGGFTGPGRRLPVDLSPYDWVVGVSDVTLTGHADVIVRSRGNGRLWLLPATADGFGARRYLGEGMTAYDLAG